MHFRLLLPIALALLAMSFDTAAQGFPGGGGHGGMGNRGMRPPREDRPNVQTGTATPNPLVTFLGALHALRAAIVVRADQANAWTAMQDALLALADAERSAQAPAPGDPEARLRAYVDDLDERAAATQTAGDRIASVLAVLDDTQKTMFIAGLGQAFAGASARP
jgi:hypothetical protein